MRFLRRLVVLLVLVAVTLVVVTLGSAALDRPSVTVREEMVVTAPRAHVWQLLSDFERYGEWNPFITDASGEARKGAAVDLSLQLGDEPNGTHCDVLDVKEPRKLRWRCRMYAPGVLDREHTFRLLPLGPDRVRLVYEGRWEGVLQPFADLDDWKHGYERMAHALKERAEATS